MYKIAFLGCENSHVKSFIKIIQQEYPDIQVMGVHSEFPGEAEKLHEEFGVPVMESSDALVGQLDGLVVNARHGGKHYPQAKAYLNDNISMFIDKPITATEEDAREFAAELSRRGIRACGGSMLKHTQFIQELKELVQNGEKGEALGGFFRAPILLGSEHGGFSFYGQHLVQMVAEVFGYHPKSVKACRTGGEVSCLIRYDGLDVSAVYLHDSNVFYAAVNFPKETVGSGVRTAGAANREFQEFYDLLTGGKMQQSYDDLFAPVFIMNAIERAMESGKEEPVKNL